MKELQDKIEALLLNELADWIPIDEIGAEFFQRLINSIAKKQIELIVSAVNPHDAIFRIDALTEELRIANRKNEEFEVENSVKEMSKHFIDEAKSTFKKRFIFELMQNATQTLLKELKETKNKNRSIE